ncbi:hypothetical protein [Oceanivirga salmonicida]|uniref:hypothetical protein n=1 Tax=Oceanivirga salmonicida TaxID=1769291 RepID=UPI0012E2337C|nr:hypothetical protein [Oceanivirga salmonicida]
MKKIIKILIIFIFSVSCYDKTLKKDFVDIVKKEFNLTFDDEKIEMQLLMSGIDEPASLKIIRKDFNNEYVEIWRNDFEKVESKIKILYLFFETLGYEAYIENELIYDLSKGNNFHEIEKILNEYAKNKNYKLNSSIQYYIKDNNVLYGIESKTINYSYWNMENYDFGKYKLNKDESLEKKKILEEREIAKKYFEEPRVFPNIDWWEYINKQNYYIVYAYDFYNSPNEALKISEKDRKELIEKIKPYYNSEIMEVVIIDPE